MISLDETLEALAHLLCSEREARRPELTRAQHKHHAVPPAFFDGFEVLTSDDPEDFVLLGSNADDLPFWPLDICYGFPALPEHEWVTGSWQFTRMRTLDPREWRGKLRIVARRMIEHATLISQPSGDCRTVLTAWALHGGKAISPGGCISQSSYDTPPLYEIGPTPGWYGHKHVASDAEVTDWIRVAAGLSLRRQYLWSVLLGEGVGPRARFTTDAIGIREAFRLRDIPPGKQRRAALLHWVKAHWRKSRASSAGDKAWVNAYVRGVWAYTWNGLRCQIEPSIEDMELLTNRPARRVMGQ